MESGLKLGRSNNAVKAFLNIVNIPKPAADRVISGQRCPRSRRATRVYAAATKGHLRFDLESSVRGPCVQLSGPQRVDP